MMLEIKLKINKYTQGFTKTRMGYMGFIEVIDQNIAIFLKEKKQFHEVSSALTLQ
jgi:hypothetical protein